MMKYIGLILLLWGSSQAVWAQSDPDTTITRQLICAAGDTTSAGGFTISYSIGDLITTTVISLGGDIVLTQGFQQPFDDTIVSNEPLLDILVSYNIFPNPTPEELYVELESDKPIRIKLAMYDIQGKILAVIPDQEVLVQGKKMLIFDLDPLADGYYLLGMQGEDPAQIQYFKIEKVH